MITTVSTRLDSTHIQMLVGHLHLAAHGRRLAVIDAMGVAVLHIHLGTVALAVDGFKAYLINAISSARTRCSLTHRLSRMTPFVSRTISACSQN